MTSTANQVAKAHSIATDHGFWEELKPDDALVVAKLALIHSEASEALEAHRAGDLPGMMEELADVIIRTYDLAAHFGMDVEGEVERKMNINKTRPPKHNKRY